MTDPIFFLRKSVILNPASALRQEAHRGILHMKKATVNDYFRHHWMKLMLFALFTAAVSFFAPLKNFQLK